ncbi:carboxypeptidase regulatory-like domain-containing protein [Candidatus Parcubacteria bacterium]|nr:carboxypeptidase regulatory-like domain-containing protein [Candidatus Parcubacteria bacterium]
MKIKKTISVYSSCLILIFAFALTLVSINFAYAQNLANTLKGKILLQVEQNGEAWYINPANEKRYYMGRPTDAFNLMRDLGVGITNVNLEKIQIADANLSGIDSDGDGLSDMIEDAIGSDKNKSDTDEDGYGDKSEILNGYNPNNALKLNVDKNFAGNQSGKILLQVEQNGEAWYVNPENSKRYFLGRPNDAFNVMRSLGLGITDNNLNLITTNNNEQNSKEKKDYSLFVEFSSENGTIGLIDSASRRIGKFSNFLNNEAQVHEINEIPGAAIENNDSFVITIPGLMFNGDYDIYISGLDNGEYDLNISRLDDKNKEIIGAYSGVLSKHRKEDGGIKNANKENPSLINPVPRGSLSGKITDSAGNLIDSSEVVINTTSSDGSKYSDADGLYYLYNILSGDYSIYARRFGYTINEKTPITILSGKNTEVDDLILIKTTRYYVDYDGDGYGGEYSVDSIKHPGDNFVLKGNDCNDWDANINFDAEEICDNIDNNCDGEIDEGLENCNISIEEKIEPASLYVQSITAASSNNPNTVIAFYAYYYDSSNSNENRGYLTYLGDLGSDNVFVKSGQASDKNGILFLLVMSSGNSIEEQIITITADGENLDVYLPTESPYIITGERYYVSQDSSTYYQLYQGNGDFVSPAEAFNVNNIAGNANITE